MSATLRTASLGLAGLLILLLSLWLLFTPPLDTRKALAAGALIGVSGYLLGGSTTLSRVSRRDHLLRLAFVGEKAAQAASVEEVRELYCQKLKEVEQIIERSKPGFLGRCLSHELFGIFVAAAVTSFLIPKFISYFDREQAVRDAKLKHAQEIIEQSTEVNRKLTVLRTELELFHKYAHSSFYKEEQRALKREMNTLYLEFDRLAWWWHWAARERIILQKLISEQEIMAMAELLTKYTKNLEKSGTVLEGIWKACLGEDYRPGSKEITALLDSANSEFKRLGKERNDLIGKICKKFVLD